MLSSKLFSEVNVYSRWLFQRKMFSEGEDRKLHYTTDSNTYCTYSASTARSNNTQVKYKHTLILYINITVVTV